MKNKFILAIVVLITLSSCTKIGEGNYESDRIDRLINKIEVSWGVSVDDIKSSMEGFRLISESSGNLLFVDDRGSIFICYEFEDNELVASAGITRRISNSKVSKLLLRSYEKIGSIGDNELFADMANNTLCVLYEQELDDTSYSIIGFAPIESSHYTPIEPIRVTTGQAYDISYTDAKVPVSISGVSYANTLGIRYGASPELDFSNSIQKTTVSSANKDFSVSGLEVNTVYYVQGYAIVDGIYYFGEIESFSTLYAKKYSVGDFYPDEVNPEGVVWEIEQSGIHGTIVSLDEASWVQWSTSGIGCTYYGNKNTTDGSKNKLSSSMPYGKWIYEHGTGWYGPATGELKALNSVLDKVNPTLYENGYSELHAIYWASTEYANNEAYAVCVTQRTVCGFDGGWMAYYSKDQHNNGRAMKHF